MCSNLASSKGQSLLEVIVVVAVGVVVVSSLVFATIASLRNAQFAQNQNKATKLAQEGIEGVRSARNRSGVIKGLFTADVTWEDARFWQPTSIVGTCASPCYFRLVNSYELNWLSAGSSDSKLPVNAEVLDTQFKRAVILADDGNLANSKKVTVVVTWTDFAGDHESRLSTILRNLNQ